MTLETLLFLRQLLTAQQLAVGAPDFREATVRVITALDEIDAEIATRSHAEQ